ncbi:MAG TPA: hypothetical protein VM925_35620 [Labilithrix sp.]|nr:hypothetical protein [Labilithrix sp.]
MRFQHVLLSLVAVPVGLACGGASSSTGSAEQDDTGWLGDTSFELGGTIASTVTQKAEGEWADLATNEELQIALVDAQWKFAKNRLKKVGYHLNQLADTVRVTNVKTEGDLVSLTYEAKVDLLRELASGQNAPPTLEQLDQRSVALKLPVQPLRAFADARSRCVDTRDGVPDGERNFYYYFDVDAPGCELPTVSVNLDVTEVYPRQIAFPEYDQLLATDIGGKKGFRAALVPATGDYDPMSRFDAHKRMLETDLRLRGEPVEGGRALRFTYTKGNVAIEIDLFDPMKTALTSQFRAALGDYQLVFFNGHSVYGTRELLTDEASFSDRYQIVMMHSCRSYPYYVRQVFRAKATGEDPTGWAMADVVATGESSYPTDSPRTLSPLLQGLLDGMAAANDGTGASAPSWNAIVKKMNDRTSGILYGVAGVRTNAWKPR